MDNLCRNLVLILAVAAINEAVRRTNQVCPYAELSSQVPQVLIELTKLRFDALNGSWMR